MQGNDERPWQWTCKVKINVGPAIIGNIALLNNALLLELLMRELVGSENLMFLLLPSRALALTSDIM